MSCIAHVKKSLAFILADGFQLLARPGNSIPLMLRYQAQLERLYRRAVEEFERVKKLRPELSDEPISEDDEPIEPQENTTDSSSQERSPNEPISSPSVRPSGAGPSAGLGGAGASARRFRLPIFHRRQSPPWYHWRPNVRPGSCHRCGAFW